MLLVVFAALAVLDGLSTPIALRRYLAELPSIACEGLFLWIAVAVVYVIPRWHESDSRLRLLVFVSVVAGIVGTLNLIGIHKQVGV